MMFQHFKPYYYFSLLYATILLFGINKSFAQLPDPKDFCSHFTAKEHHSSRQAFLYYDDYDAYDISFYYINLWAETDNSFINGFVEIKAQSLDNNLDTLYLELSKQLQVDSILFNEMMVPFTHTENDILFFSPKDIIPPNTSFDVIIYYQGQAHYSGNGQGYNNKLRHNKRISWTLSEPFYSKDWWPCKQDLQDKADSIWVFISTSDKNKVGSNGILTNSIPLENNKIRYEWKSRYPIAYYLISISIAEYMEYNFYSSANNEGVWMQNYLYADSSIYKSQKALIDCTQLEMNLLREKYGEYPFIDEKYGHCITPISGGMEHQTMTTQNSFNWHLSIHEMGHSWFGNHVTCAQWNDIWINEGFATYTQFIGLENMLNSESAQAFMAAMQSVVMRKPDGSVYVPDEFIADRDRIFSGRLSYYKGATIIHMIRYLLADDELFFQVLQEFQNRYAFSTASGEDFKTVLEELSGKDFDAFFNLWYYEEGFPIYHFEWNQNTDKTLDIKSFQKSSTSKSSLFDMYFDLMIYFKDGSDTLIQIHQQETEHIISLHLHKTVYDIVPNPYNWNLMEVDGVFSNITLPGVVNIQPNPAHDLISIRFANTKPKRKIALYNANLKMIQELNAMENYIEIDISHFAVGIYFIKISDQHQQQLRKFIKY